MTAPQVLLATNRPQVEHAWQQLGTPRGLNIRICDPSQACAELDRCDALVVDVACQFFDDDDELLVTIGKGRALGLHVGVVVEHPERLEADADLIAELCQGLVFYRAIYPDEIIQALSRRLEPRRASRFEYVTVDPNGPDVLAIVGTSQTVLVPRPLTKADDGTPISNITLNSDATCALIELKSGRMIELRPSDLPDRPGASPLRVNAEQRVDADPENHLGVRLKQLRVRHGLTQAEVARRSGIHRPNIARVEAGRHTPSLDTLRRLADAIGVSTSEILNP